MQPVVCPVHVGRDDEMRALAEAVARVRSDGRGVMQLVTGQAGVGKSRLAAEAVRMAGEAGLTGLEGRCHPEASVAYSCFVNAIRRRTRSLGADELADLFDGSATLAAALLPEVAAQVGLPVTNPAPEDLFAAVWQLLARLARPNGALLLLEDLHWADPDSLRLLSHLSGELDDLPVWLVGTYRSDELHRRHPLTAVLADLGRERRFEEVVLEPLARDQVRAMVSAIFDGTEVGDEFSSVMMERTGGNPFFVEELAKVLVERGDVYRAGDDWERKDLADIEMPLSVRDTLLARARSMEPAGVKVLQVAALAADELDVAVLADAVGVSEEHVDDVVREGLGLQLLVERRDGPRSRYGFRHALTREAFADELAGPDRRRAHRRIAEALVRTHPDDTDAVAAPVADHFAAAGDDVAAIEFALRAARRAAGSFAGDEADRRYDQALRLLRDSDERRLELLLEAAGDGDAGEVPRLRLVFAEEARALAVARADPVAQARAINVLEQGRWLAGDSAGALALLAEARSLLAGRDDYLEAWVVRRLSRVLALVDRNEEAEALIPEGIDLAKRSGNLSALSGLYGTRMLIEGHGPGLDDTYAAAVEAARAARDPQSELNVTHNRGFTGLWCGDFQTAGLAFARAVDIVERISPTEKYAHAGQAWLLSLQGHYEAAEQLARPLRSNRPLPTRLVALTALAEAAQRRGASEAGSIVGELWDLTRATAENQRWVPAVSAAARQVLEDDGLDAALPLFQDLARGTPRLRHASHWPFSPDLARALAEEGRVAELEAWVAQVRRITEADDNGHNLAALALCSAHLAAAQGEVDAARTAFADAVARYGAMPCPARVVEALVGAADVDWRAGGPDTGESAAAEALRLAQGLGAQVLVTVAERAVDRTRARPVLATILFTDIVGSTELAAGLGDRGWSGLLERHHAIVRRELSRAGGRELDTAGDGFLASFDTPAQAIRCAGVIRDALEGAGITVRAGLHTGECRESGGKLTGLTVHIAARVNHVAAPGEVLVSGTVKDLVVGSGLAFDDRGDHELKGVPGRWRLFAVATG